MPTSAKIILDSISPQDIRLTTIEVTLPRFVLAELNTHRMFSRNSASSRAIPVARQIERVLEDPFVPAAFPINKRGMSADDYITPDGDSARYEQLASLWLYAMQQAVNVASEMLDEGVHKQIATRVLEPFMWHTVLISATEWGNFYALRCHPAAQPEIREAAELMQAAMRQSKPAQINNKTWHLPLVTDEERDVFGNAAIAISAGRCARVSYDRIHDEESIADSTKRALMLREMGHWSPWEHQARPTGRIITANYRGWIQARTLLERGEELA